MKHIEIMDATLRDGEQAPNIAYTPSEKLQIAQLLISKVNVDRIEVASAGVSEGEKEGARNIIKWAKENGRHESVEILGFANKKSVDWINEIDGKVINLLTKGSERHCRGQLRKTPEEHYAQVADLIDYTHSLGMTVNVYLEDWSGGMKENKKYVFDFIDKLLEKKVKRIMLADTLGIVNSQILKEYLDETIAKYPDAVFDYHGHNDYGLATANSIVAANANLNAVHCCVNGLGERAGNASLCEVVANINDMTERTTIINEDTLNDISTTVMNLSGKRMASNSPIVGVDVYTQTCGVHADGDKKGNLYANALTPERFNRKRIYALGKLSGKASIDKNLEVLGLELNDSDRDKVLKEVIKLGDRKEKVTPEDLPFIIADVLKTDDCNKVVEFVEYEVVTKKGSLPFAKIKLTYNEETLSAESSGDGGYDAFMQAVRLAMDTKGITIPILSDYEVRIPPGGKTDALVETSIKWQLNCENTFITTGVECDQLEAAIDATEKMLNIVLNND